MRDESRRELAELIANASAALIVTGAGISTSSGIPDFRGPSGVWTTQRPVDFSDFLTSEESRVEYWEQKVVSASYMDGAVPGRVHTACVELERGGKLEAIVTQNIDGLHSDAGSSLAKVVEVHGTARESGCLDCGSRTPVGPHLAAFSLTKIPPECAECGGMLKPATISFGQALDQVVIHRAVRAAESCDLVVALGTTLSVYPAADIPLRAAGRGVPYVIVNQGQTDHDNLPSVALRIDGDVGEVFGMAVEDALA